MKFRALLLLLASGCSAGPPRRSVETFASPPRHWVERTGPGESPAQLEVSGHQLDLAGPRVLIDETSFRRPRAQVDVALTGSEPRALAGIFASPAGGGEGYVLAVRPTGEWRVYRALDPRLAVGGGGWKASVSPPGGFHRLSLEVAADAVRFEIDGRTAGGLAGQDLSAPGWRVGIFNEAGASRWNNFVVLEVHASAAEDALAFVDWGGTQTARARWTEFVSLARSYSEESSRAEAMRLLAALEGALRAAEVDADLHAELRRTAADLTGPLIAAAQRAGDEDLLARSLARTLEEPAAPRAIPGGDRADFVARAREAEAGGGDAEAAVFWAAAVDLEPSEEGEKALKRTLLRLEPLSYSLHFDGAAAADEIASEAEVLDVLRFSWGALPRRSQGDLTFRFSILRAEIESIRDPDAVRSIAVRGQGAGLSAERAAELAEIEDRLADELEEARVRAEVIRAGSVVLGPGSLARLEDLTLDGAVYSVPSGDAARILGLAARRDGLRRERAAAERDIVHWESIGGRMTTVSVLLEVRMEVAWRGETIASADRYRAYRGVEQWDHPADPARGVPASTSRPEEVAAAVAAVRDKALARMRTLASRESISSRLNPRDKLPFLLRLARTTRQPEDVDSLKWQLQEGYGFRQSIRDAVTARLVQ